MTKRIQWRSRVVSGAAALACVVAGSLAAVAPANAETPTQTTASPSGATAPGTPIPAHVFAPYFFNDNPADELYQVSQDSGAHYMTLAFLETLEPGACTVYWNGRKDSPIGATYAEGIKKIRAAGGDVFPSFGGARAGDEGTTLAESCHDVDAIANEYKRVITAYNFTRIDLDIEGPALSDPESKASVDRRNKAIKIVKQWAKDTSRTVDFVYTQPTFTNGLNDGSKFLLENAAKNNVEIDGFNIMTFDYYDDVSNACASGDGEAHDMAADTISAATALNKILRHYYPGLSKNEAWQKIGIIEMPGNSDFGACEAFTPQHAAEVLTWAIDRDINLLSFWSIQRDGNGPAGAQPYQYSHMLSPFTHTEDASQLSISANVQAGPLTLTLPKNKAIDLGTITLNGQDQVMDGKTGTITVTDARGSGAPWNLTGQVSDLRSTTDDTIDAANLGWVPRAEAVGGTLDLVRDDASGAGVITGPAAKVGEGLDSPHPLCSAGEKSGSGSYECSAKLKLGVPYDAAAGAYTGVLTLTLI